MTEAALYARMYTIDAAVFGLLLGSFLNVCIYRWTRDLSVVRPRSACPSCNHMIAWYDNVPLLSFLLLRGRCRNCRAPIPWTYPAVELLTSLFFGYFVAVGGLNLATVKDCLFAAIMIGLIFSDLDTRLLPDEFTVGGLVAGLVLALFVPLPTTAFGLMTELSGLRLGPTAISLGEALLGALIPAGAMWLLGWCIGRILHKEALGFGDVKMVAMMGVFLGIGKVLAALMLGSLLGTIVGLPLKITRKDQESDYYLPFASFLGAAGLIVTANIFGIVSWYEHLLR